MNRITLVIPSLTSGGAERVMTTLANAWATRGQVVTLLTFDDGREKPFYDLDPRVVHRPLAIAGSSTSPLAAVANNTKRIRTLRHAIRQANPEIVLSFLDTTNVTTLIATRGMGVPVIVEEHTDPSQKQLGTGWERLRQFFYPRANRVVVLSEQAKAFFPHALQRRSSIIPNPIVVEQHGPARPGSRSGRQAIAMGRLGPEKGFDLLITAFAEIAEENPDWQLVIWGEGALRPELEALIEHHKMKTRISLPGRTQAPHDELRAADLFVMSSRREGFPMALGEAMECGLAVVSTDCPSGPRQLIRDGYDGVLVEPDNPQALATAMQTLMRDEVLRASLAKHAPQVLDRFGLKSVLAQWDELFAQLLHSSSQQESRRIRTNGLTRTGTTEGPEG